MLSKDGGKLEIVDIKDRTIYVRLAGACASCVGANQGSSGFVVSAMLPRRRGFPRCIEVSTAL
jgi:Fe-S cluster biogenesis protein NfuA